MRIFIATALLALLGVRGASAKTYQLTYTGNRLSVLGDYRPIRHAKRVVLVMESSTPYPKNECFTLPVTALSSLSDGADTMASLQAAGYTLNPPTSSISLCTDAGGKQVVSWQIMFEFDAVPQGGAYADEYYLSSLSAPPHNPSVYDAAVFRTQNKKGGRVNYRGDGNLVSAGTWRYKVLDN